MKPIKINQGRVLNKNVRVALITIIFGLMYATLLTQKQGIAITIAIVLSLLIPPIWSTYKVIVIDSNTQTIQRYTWLTGRKFNTLQKSFVPPYQLRIDNHYKKDLFDQKDKNLCLYAEDTNGQIAILHKTGSMASLEEKRTKLNKLMS